jgi:steroid 5-alpha reductase family enzyme
MLLIMSIPSFLINKSHLSGLALLDFIGIIVWLVGFFFEAVSDYQLFEFTKNPANKGKLMKYGLWHYSRHPNYFGEVVMWWGIFLIALNVPYGYLALISAGTITFLLLFVTGIPWVEQALAKNPEYPEYKRTTSIFIPWFPKK